MAHDWRSKLNPLLQYLKRSVSFAPILKHLIKIPFINKGVHFIDLPRFFRDRPVTSAMPTYFKSTETSIIWYIVYNPFGYIILN